MSSEDKVYNINNICLLIPSKPIPPQHAPCILHVGNCLREAYGASLSRQTSLSTLSFVPWNTICVCPGWMYLNEGSRAFPPWKRLPFTSEKSCQLLSPLTIICCCLEMGKWQLLKGISNNLQLKAKTLPTMPTFLFPHRKTKYLESVNACQMPS